ncbi:MAG: hypothetical protein JRH11_18045 [Deltaproteobacteria bacterium]|nr:hypothetical protein [Deltaproteobacteria bacterium]
MLVVEGDITVTPMLTRIGIVDGATFTEVEGFVPGAQRLLRGDVGAYGFLGMAIIHTGSLYGVTATGSSPPIAREPTANWQWSSAQVVSAGILGLSTQSILVLRANFETSQLQLIRFWRPGT